MDRTGSGERPHGLGPVSGCFHPVLGHLTQAAAGFLASVSVLAGERFAIGRKPLCSYEMEVLPTAFAFLDRQVGINDASVTPDLRPNGVCSGSQAVDEIVTGRICCGLTM